MCDWDVGKKMEYLWLETPVAGETPSLRARMPTSFPVQRELLTPEWVVSLEQGCQPKLLKHCCALCRGVSVAVTQGQYSIKGY